MVLYVSYKEIVNSYFLHYNVKIQAPFITVRKRRLGQGNMFTGVYLSTGGVPGAGDAWSWGVPGGDTHPGRLLLRAVRILLEYILVSSEIKINVNGKRRFSFVNDNNSILSSPSARLQDSTICHFLGILINIGVYRALPHMASKYIFS